MKLRKISGINLRCIIGLRAYLFSIIIPHYWFLPVLNTFSRIFQQFLETFSRLSQYFNETFRFLPTVSIQFLYSFPKVLYRFSTLSERYLIGFSTLSQSFLDTLKTYVNFLDTFKPQSLSPHSHVISCLFPLRCLLFS